MFDSDMTWYDLWYDLKQAKEIYSKHIQQLKSISKTSEQDNMMDEIKDLKANVNEMKAEMKAERDEMKAAMDEMKAMITMISETQTGGKRSSTTSRSLSQTDWLCTWKLNFSSNVSVTCNNKCNYNMNSVKISFIA